MKSIIVDLYRVFVTALTTFFFAAGVLLTPANEAKAATGQFNTVWRTTDVNGLTALTWPDENWTDISTATYTGTSGTPAASKGAGEQWVLNGDTNAGILGLNSFQAGNFVQYNAGRPPIIFARYFAEEAQLRVTAIRVIRAGNTIHVQKADFTPWHGLDWARDRYFLTAAEKANNYTVGHNPFGLFNNGDKTDPAFYNIGWNAAQVAVGLAMAHYRASMAFIAMPKLSLNQNVTTSGGWLRRTTTITTTGYAQPLWYVAMPISAQPYGSISQICAASVSGGSSCDDPAHVVSSGVSVQSWTGGVMPDTNDLMYTNVETEHSWGVLAFALLTIALVAVGGAALAGVLAAASAVGGTAIAVGSISATEIATAAVASGMAYTATSEIIQGGSLLSAQAGYLGTTSGAVPIPTSSSTYQTGLQDAVEPKAITNDMSDSLSGVTALYQGSCGPGATYASCTSAGQNPGMAPRTDDQENQNNVPNTAARYSMCQQAGYTGANLDRCASGALLTPEEATMVTNSGSNAVTEGDMLPPTSAGANSASDLYYDGAAPSR
jgi:hypothetical protein